MDAEYARQNGRNLEGFLVFAFAEARRRFRKPLPRPDSRVVPNRLLDAYAAHCRDHRGLHTMTLANRHRHLLRFRTFLEDRGITRLKDVTIRTMDEFFQRQSRRMSVRSLGIIISTTRSFFRFLQLHGQYPSNLADDMTPPCRYSADTRPKYIPWRELQAFLDQLDRSTAFGKRNFALTVLFAHHGLRPVEVARLKIADIDWNGSSLLLNPRKNGSCVHFPMTSLAHAALRDYLAVRPSCALPEAFVTAAAPLRPLRAKAMGAILSRLLRRRFGNSLRCYGPYVLRHSFAKSLLDRGATLPEVGAMLGHKRLNNTLMYSRIHTKELGEVADTYAGLLR